MKKFLPVALLFCVLSHLPWLSSAQGTCPGFGADGIAATLESHSTHLNALTVLSNGKIVAVGYYNASEGKDMLVARYNANGTPDLTFSHNGIRTYDPSDHGDDEALCVAIASDGNILVGGISEGYGSIIKIDGSGKLVSSFGSSGEAKYDILYSSVEDIVVSPQGIIYGVGKSFHTENIVFRRLKVQAYNSNGTLLTDFSDDGKYDRTDFFLWHKTVVRGALQSDGKLVVGGTTPSANNLLDKWFLLRLNTNGTPDNSFHADGLAEDPEGVTAYLKDLEIGSDGSIYVGGFNNLNSDFPTTAVAKKFKPNGDSDNSFNMTGSAYHLGAGNSAMMHALTVDENGKVYFAGSKGTEEDNKDLLIGAFDPDGEHDPAFTLTDKITGTSHGELLDIVRLTDGSFVACGYAVGQDREYGILRKYNADGSVETSFNASGANFIRHAEDGSSKAVAVQSDGKIIVGGAFLANGSNTGIAVARFLTDGSPDLSFGTYGYIRLDLSERREFVYDFYVYPDGKILVGGSMYGQNSGEDFLVVKLNPDGSLDEDFGDDGFVTKHVGAYGKHNKLNSLTVDAEGRILIAGDGNYNGGSYQNATVMRLLPDGTADPDFATDGVFNINLTVVNDFFQDLVIGSDGSIYAAGYGTVNVGGAVVKLNDSGELDTSFGTDGVFSTDWKEEYLSRVFEIVLQPDGKLVVACSHEPEDGSPIINAYMYRILPSGEPDPGFGENGIAAVPSETTREIYGLALDDAGFIYMSAATNSDLFISKVDMDGNLVGDEMRLYDIDATTNIAINRTTGNLYAGVSIDDSGGLGVACIGSSGSVDPGGDCEDVADPVITIQGDVLMSSEADAYQWYSSGELMEGETSRFLEINPAIGGVFAVEVTIGDCALFSDDFDYVVTGLREKVQALNVYPNPTREYVVIESETDLQNAEVFFSSTSGNVVYQVNNLSGTHSNISIKHLPSGLYILSVQSVAGTQRIKVLKQN